ncbi:L-seryl-tRNA(Sec) selenium transferase [Candidatus Oleimmundimicrobium sp.]|uniref:L-seryl-tRNA(Sec) selenium transferase n=1 Tax=Candidatus Oleimmundimicrobium sp. TaxID=3060597 RepID=UPI0027242F32|nr:L-seryl-tRNA(Sec) selenium transferase [Candidatus Oleimmundimicrobium sp.]MDO8885640.1 L-seryl-tRNA(Sec) selenium transferase [Candidatus Oleimmundimicrobium sp.]
MTEKKKYLRKLSAVDEILELSAMKDLISNYPRMVVVNAVRTVINKLRKTIIEAKKDDELKDISLEPEDLVPLVSELVKEVMSPSLRRVINATGVVVHTNLGRSILAPSAVDAVLNVASSYSNLEFNLDKGVRGDRHSHVESLLCALTGAEAAMVVNNNAGAVLLALSTIANGKEVVISRGQLVEIGGSFRIPDVMRQSGAILKEVGATNKTYLEDYREAIGEETALLLKVHTSNFKVVGFAAEVSLQDLVTLGKEHNLPVMDDLGSGVFLDLSEYGLPSHEPTVCESVKAGADIVTFSGDKLLGAPQAGIIVGEKKLIEQMKKDPLTRALRVDKLTLAGLEETLRLYLDPAKAIEEIPTLNMILTPLLELKKKAAKLARKINEKIGTKYLVEIIEDTSRVGGGALPLVELPTAVVALSAKNLSVSKLESKLRKSDPSIISRVHEDKVFLDVRTIQPEEIEEIVGVLATIC